MCPVTFESVSSSGFSILKLARALSPKMDLKKKKIFKHEGHPTTVSEATYFAYIFAAIKPHCPDRAFSGVKHFMLVLLSRCFKYSCKSVKVVFTVTCKKST